MTETKSKYTCPNTDNDTGHDANQSLDLTAIEARLVATDPPWGLGKLEKNCIASRDGDGIVILRREGRNMITQADFDLIAHAPRDLRALLAEVKRLRLQVEQLADALEVGIEPLSHLRSWEKDK